MSPGSIRSRFCAAQTPGIAIRLELEPDRQAVALAPAGARWTLLHLFRRAEQILDVMAEFVGDHIILREIALGAEAVGEFVEEAGVEIDALIGRAVERPHRRLRGAAARLAVAVDRRPASAREALARLLRTAPPRSCPPN